MDIKDIFNALKPLKKRIYFKNLLDFFTYFFIGAGMLALIFSITSLFIPITFVRQKILVTYVIFISLSYVLSVILMPKPFKIAKIADSLGLKERVITSYELKEDKSNLAKIQRNDTLKVIKNIDFKSSYKIKIPYHKFLVGVILLTLTLTVFIIPTGAREKALLKEEIQNETKKQIEQIEEKRKNLNKDKRISHEKLTKMDEIVEELLKELKSIKDEEEAIKALSKARNQLEELKHNGLEEIQNISEKLRESQLSKDLANTLDNKDMEAIKEQLKNLKELENLEIDQLSYMLSDGINELLQVSGDNFGFSNLAEKDNQGDGEGRHNTEDQGNEEGQGDGKSQGNEEGQDDGGGQEGNEEGQGGNGKGQGNGEGQDGGGGQGDEEGQSDGGGSGIGTSTSNKDGGYSNSHSDTTGSIKNSGSKVRDYEQIYVPQRLGGDSEVSQVTGTAGESGETQIIQTDGPMLKGSVLPYNEVIGEYKEKGMASVKDAPIPQGMKDIVRDYFSTLDD